MSAYRRETIDFSHSRPTLWVCFCPLFIRRFTNSNLTGADFQLSLTRGNDIGQESVVFCSLLDCSSCHCALIQLYLSACLHQSLLLYPRRGQDRFQGPLDPVTKSVKLPSTGFSASEGHTATSLSATRQLLDSFAEQLGRIQLVTDGFDDCPGRRCNTVATVAAATIVEAEPCTCNGSLPPPFR